MTDKIAETRTGVTDVKLFIDGMRSSRDTKMKEMSDLKAQLKDQNERLIKVTQEKAKMDAKNKARQGKVEEGREDELTEFDIKKKQKEEHVAELREKLATLKEKEEETKNKYESEKAGLDEHREQLKKIIETCKSLYDEFDDKRREIKAEKSKRIRELTDPSFAWDVKPQPDEAAAPAPSAAGDNVVQYMYVIFSHKDRYWTHDFVSFSVRSTITPRTTRMILRSRLEMSSLFILINPTNLAGSVERLTARSDGFPRPMLSPQGPPRRRLRQQQQRLLLLRPDLPARLASSTIGPRFSLTTKSPLLAVKWLMSFLRPTPIGGWARTCQARRDTSRRTSSPWTTWSPGGPPRPRPPMLSDRRLRSQPKWRFLCMPTLRMSRVTSTLRPRRESV